MDFNQKTKNIILILWICTALPMMPILYFVFPQQPIDWEIFIYLLALALVTTAIPFHIGNATIILSQWVSIAAFLLYGVGVEMIIVQACILPIAYHMRTYKDSFYRTLFVSWMFVWVSLISASLTHLLGFQLGNTSITHLSIFAFIFIITNLFINHLILFARDWLLGDKGKFWSADAIWDYSGALITLPFALSLVILIEQIHAVAFFLLGIPFIVVAVVMRMYNTAEKVNLSLSKASEIGHEMADRLSVNQIIDLFMMRVSELFPLDGIYIVDNIKGKYVVMRAKIDGEEVLIHSDSDSIKRSFIHTCFIKSSKRVYVKSADWSKDAPDFISKDMNSLLIVPIHRNKKTEGMVILTARKKYAFERYQMDIVHLLSTYFAVSLEKAKYVNAAVEKSETCALTGLYNYRYLDKALELEQERVVANPHLTLSMLMLDIDHFKKINDTYGHHAGNIVLKDFATLVSKFVPEEATFARYGGEEFVILMPNITKAEAYTIGEKIRQKVATTPFLVDSDLTSNREDAIIFITVSIGVSNLPEDTDEAITMLRNADRALYIGAKQAGRNKVAEYIK